ncbi:AMP-binding protein, partial [Kineococcus glutinatus]|uniref:AMP-binding protein n=1 Tax=Kineococcus glutinatus TaxID=1070872 RepID=UPI0031E7F9A6
EPGSGSGGAPVAVLQGHDAGAVAAILGVVASGALVVVLDPTTPAARLRHYVEAAGARLCISDAARAATAAEVCELVLDPDADGAWRGADLEDAARELTAAQRAATDPALIVYTSGSTGKPKGVSCDHRSVLHDAWTNAVATGCYGAGDTVAHVLPMGFSAGIGVTLTCLLVGARQELFDPRSRSVAQLPGWLRQVGADALLASPAILRGALAALPPGERLADLSVVTVAGETVHGAELAALRAAVGPACEVRNRYGSTETWLMSEFVIAPADPAPAGATPVGRAVPGVRLRVETPDGELRSEGTGRIVLTSRWLGGRYWGEDELTAASFTDEPDGTRSFRTSDVGALDADGCLRLLGRSDHSVKVRGLLVAPGEVDAVLFARPDVREAVVVGLPSPSTGRTRLVAYVVPVGERPAAAAVRAAVRAVLPAHMVPEQVVFLEALPRTERGKLDRAALPQPPDVVVGADAPRTDFERVVAGLFARVLELDEVGVHDDFFALGGDSLAAEALMAAVSSEVGVDGARLSTAMLVTAPTVADFARVLRGHRRSASGTHVVLREGGTRTPLFCVAGAGAVAVGLRPLAQHLDPDQPVHALQAHRIESGGLPDWSIRATARRHLTTIRGIQPHGPYRLAGHSLGGLVALEIAHRLRAAGEEVELLAVLDSFPPDPALAPPVLEGSLPNRVKEVLTLLGTGFVPSRVGGHYLRFHRQGMAMHRMYRAPAYTGRTLVVVAADDRDAVARSRWAPHLAGPWRVEHVRGDHTSILREPHVRGLAAVLQGALDELPTAAATGSACARGPVVTRQRASAAAVGGGAAREGAHPSVP